MKKKRKGNLKRKLVEEKYRKIRKKYTPEGIIDLIGRMVKFFEKDFNENPIFSDINENHELKFSKEEYKFYIEKIYKEYKILSKHVNKIRSESDFENVMYDAYERFDLTLNGLKDVLELDVKCSKGCWYCCHQSIEISYPSFCMLSKHIDKEIIESAKDFMKDYKRIGNPCPFLKNEVCSIYSDRPFVCRSYISISSPIYCKNHYIDLEKNSFKGNQPIIYLALSQLTDAITDFVFESYGYQRIYDKDMCNLIANHNLDNPQKWLNKNHF